MVHQVSPPVFTEETITYAATPMEDGLLRRLPCRRSSQATILNNLNYLKGQKCVSIVAIAEDSAAYFLSITKASLPLDSQV
jgi:hypothetical protein